MESVVFEYPLSFDSIDSFVFDLVTSDNVDLVIPSILYSILRKYISNIHHLTLNTTSESYVNLDGTLSGTFEVVGDLSFRIMFDNGIVVGNIGATSLNINFSANLTQNKLDGLVMLQIDTDIIIEKYSLGILHGFSKYIFDRNMYDCYYVNNECLVILSENNIYYDTNVRGRMKENFDSKINIQLESDKIIYYGETNTYELKLDEEFTIIIGSQCFLSNDVNLRFVCHERVYNIN